MNLSGKHWLFFLLACGLLAVSVWLAYARTPLKAPNPVGTVSPSGSPQPDRTQITAENPRGLPLELLQLPPGFRLQLFADNIPGARSLTVSPQGTVFVGTRSLGMVYALQDQNQDGRAETVYPIAANLNSPNGVAFRAGSLYVAEINRILRFDRIEEQLSQPPPPVVISSAFPADTHHGWKFIAFGPDDKLYIPVGAPCNVCLRSDERYASILRMNPDGSNLEVFASGVRNTVGFDWHPGTSELWFTDNGRDWLGDDQPPDELNRAPTAGLHFGFPFCHGSIADPVFGRPDRCAGYQPPEFELGAHVAALGMRFYTGSQFPSEYRNQIIIAEHGSWNRSQPVGYQLLRVMLDSSRAVASQPFVTGWLRADGSSWGRPVDVQVMPDGAILVSDDKAGAVYRIFYQ